ncbi:MAG: hypothetical protein ABI837_00705 [Acidobacteriota bacterium]
MGSLFLSFGMLFATVGEAQIKSCGALLESVETIPQSPYSSVPFLLKLATDDCELLLPGAVEVHGDVIEIPVDFAPNPNAFCIVSPHPALETWVAIPGLPSGSYTVRLKFPRQGWVPCDAMAVSVADGQPVPALGRSALLALALTIASVGTCLLPDRR